MDRQPQPARMKASEDQLKAFLTRKLCDEVASLLTSEHLKYMLDNGLYNEQLLKYVRPEAFESPLFSKGLRNQVAQAFTTASGGVLLAKFNEPGFVSIWPIYNSRVVIQP